MKDRPRPKLVIPATPGPEPVRFISSGSRLFDLVLGGGWPVGRIVNIVGDRASAKTLVAVEACANFSVQTPLSHIQYIEAESAFDEQYAEVIGMPPGLHPTTEIDTVENWYKALEGFLATYSASPKPKLSVLDSLDALSDAAELERELADPTYGGGKAKQLSQMLRRKVRALETASCTLLIISQVRDNIGVMFGEKSKRSGGRALDFYASQIVWLAELAKVTRTVRGVKRPTGIEIKARTKKNKCGLPFRECELTVLFGYGLDDEVSMLNHLEKYKAHDILSQADLKELDRELDSARAARDRTRIAAVSDRLYDAVRSHWMMIEAELAPKLRKYSNADDPA